MVEIYVVFHKILEDSNIFFSTYEEAYKQIEILANETNTKQEDWWIRKLQEGVKFEADFTDFFTKSNTLVHPNK